ncbi:hypothetical protein BKM31_00705 [[Actinomadura] parvosata subsp. kistnae]|uniref:Uncharacterized protein n=1 Tax=[Actinomadura] parvosata subsp. kistnae TaxID=1909395 RepID=A0A1U9ZQM2_9ACTN|nr:hypothetical protein BKM31_00705 [Nonomuraea sp. ATCC 55076]
MVARLSPAPVLGTPPGSFLPGVQATRATSHDGRITKITALAHAAPGKPDGEVDCRPLRPFWQQPEPAWREPWNDSPPARHH